LWRHFRRRVHSIVTKCVTRGREIPRKSCDVIYGRPFQKNEREDRDDETNVATDYVLSA